MPPVPSPHVRDHLEWLGFIQPTGLVVSAHALVQAGAILNRRDVEGQRLLAECVEERGFGRAPSGGTRDSDGGRDRGGAPAPDGDPNPPAPFLPDFETFARRVLGWRFSPGGYAGTDDRPIPDDLVVALHDYRDTLRPDYAVAERDPADGAPPWQLLVQTLPPGTGLGMSKRP